MKTSNSKAYETLMQLSFCPTGMLEEEITKLCPKNWNGIKAALLS